MIKVNIVMREEAPIVVGGYYRVKAADYHCFPEGTIVNIIKIADVSYSFAAYDCIDPMSGMIQTVDLEDLREVEKY